MNVNIKKSAAELALEAQVEVLLENASGGQAQALESLRHNGMPHRKLEPWVYTDLRNLVRDTYRPATEADRGAGDFKIDPALAALGVCKIVRVNGFLQDDLSDLDALPDGVSLKVQDITAGVEVDEHHFIADMVTAFASNSLVLEVAPGANVEQPILLANFTNGSVPVAAYAHTIVKMGEGASATIIESLEGEGDYQSSNLLDVSLSDKANLNFVRWQNEDVAAVHLALMRLTLGEASKWQGFTLTEGARVSRNEMAIRFTAPAADAHISVAKLLRGEQHGDTTIIVDHAVPECDSNEIIKSVLEDKARGIFQGKVIVRPGAHGTDGRQASDALLLSDQAEMDSKPELEIYNDDVQCAHGATVGEIDEDLLFYLRARGIPLKEAESLLVQAHVGGALESIQNEDVKNAMTGLAARWLTRRASS